MNSKDPDQTSHLCSVNQSLCGSLTELLLTVEYIANTRSECADAILIWGFVNYYARMFQRHFFSNSDAYLNKPRQANVPYHMCDHCRSAQSDQGRRYRYQFSD